MSDLYEIKEKLALACRLLYMEKLMDHGGLIGARMPGENRLVLNPRTMRGTLGRHPGIMIAEDMVVVDENGNQIEGINDPPSESPIFTEVFRTQTKMNACFHLHIPWATLFSTIDRPLEPLFNLAAVFGQVPVHHDPNLIQTKAQGEALANALGNARALLLRSHGAVIVGEDIETAFVASVILEENAKRLYDASLLGKPRTLKGRERQETAKRTWEKKVILKIWNYYVLKAQANGMVTESGPLAK
ncbi:MAG: class II aldolase/adducin family protein [Desulfobacterales bacterium]|nr:class II aldolase/adducin family protein [Desulfobacterales bacterium]